MSHSTAPWYLSPGNMYVRYSPEGFHYPHGPNVCNLDVFNGPDDERAANARLIIAAPDLLAACKLWQDFFTEITSTSDLTDPIAIARTAYHKKRMDATTAAIAKATGGAASMINCEQFAVIAPGREHHSEWFQLIKHPDAQLIEAAPDLLAAIKSLLVNAHPPDDGCGVHAVRWQEACTNAQTSIAKAEGR